MKLEDVGTETNIIKDNGYNTCVFVDMVIVGPDGRTLALWHPIGRKGQHLGKHSAAIRNFMEGSRK